MTNAASPTPQRATGNGGGELADQLFWLSRVDQDLPRAVITPDLKRTTAAARVYGAVGFELDPELVRLLKSAHPTRGLSNVEICAGLLAVLLSKHQREDRMLVGLGSAAVQGGAELLVPLGLPGDGEATFQSITVLVAAEVAAMSTHPVAVVPELPQILGLELSSHRHPLYDIALVVADDAPRVDLAAYPVDLAFLFETASGRIRGEVRFAQELYDAATIERLVQQLLLAAACVARQPGLRLRDVEVLSADERHAVLHGFNARSSPYPLQETFHSLFEAQCSRTPMAIAVIHGEARLSYEDLNASANRLAHTLLSIGLRQGDFVGILLQRSCDYVTAMLAVFKAGGAYVPLDPTYPRERVGYMLQDSAAAFLISDESTATQYAEVIAVCPALGTVIAMQGALHGPAWPASVAQARIPPTAWRLAPATNPALGLRGSDRAYMIYTSGSTGRPKGAICRHDGALNHLFGELEGIGVDSPFRFLQTAASSSDISVWQFMAPLLFGGATVIADYETVVDPVLLCALLRDHRVTVAEPVPVVLRALMDHLSGLPEPARALPALHCMMCTGEALPAELVDRWLALYPSIPIANTYGPTETSDDVTLLVMRRPIAGRYAVAPIGQPLPNVRIFVLDRDLQPLPVGVPGEICIAGVAVGEGYWQQPEKTAAAFVACPFPEAGTGKMYRTGDLGRWLADGSIEFLGRLDQQVKVRGFRIEPGEIEEVMTQHPAVQDAAVVAVEDGGGNRRLVGHYVTHRDQSLAAGELREFLKGRLADHMVPASLVPLVALPQTPLGKVDRRALARMGASASAPAAGQVPPRNALERTIAEIWAKVVGVQSVGALDNFFEIGGDSILSIHVVAALRQHGWRVAPREIFRHPTVAELAEHLSSAMRSADAAAAVASTDAGQPASWDVARWREVLTPVFPELEDVYPLAGTQRGIYFQSLLVPKSSGAYVEQIAFDLVGALDEKAFQQAWQHVVASDESLRTAIIRRGAPYPLQVVTRHATLSPSLLDLRDLAPGLQTARWAALVAEDRTKGFELKRPPLCRVLLSRLASERWRVLWSYHHLILDGWSEPLVLAAVFRAYDALAAGLPAPADVHPRYRDFVAWSEQQDFSGTELYWRSQLAGFVAPVNVPDPSPGVSPPSSNEVSHGWEDAQITKHASEALEQVARRHGLTTSTLVHGAWSLLLHRRTGAADVMFGSIASGRQNGPAEVHAMRGLVAVTQPLRTRLPLDTTVSAWLRLLQLQMAELREHEHTPLAQIQNWCDVAPEKRPLFDSIVVVGNYSGSDLAEGRPAALALENVRYDTQPLFALTLFATMQPSLSVSLVYDRRKYAQETARALVTEFVSLLARISENPEQRVSGLLETPGI